MKSIAVTTRQTCRQHPFDKQGRKKSAVAAILALFATLGASGTAATGTSTISDPNASLRSNTSNNNRVDLGSGAARDSGTFSNGLPGTALPRSTAEGSETSIPPSAGFTAPGATTTSSTTGYSGTGSGALGGTSSTPGNGGIPRADTGTNFGTATGVGGNTGTGINQGGGTAGGSSSSVDRSGSGNPSSTGFNFNSTVDQ